MDSGEAVEQPFYVNAKQYHRILKRRIARAKLDESLKVARGRRPYLHESRHKHAMRRPRGQGGRFLTAAEIAERERKEKEEHQENGGSADISSDGIGESENVNGDSSVNEPNEAAVDNEDKKNNNDNENSIKNVNENENENDNDNENEYENGESVVNESAEGKEGEFFLA